jgi:hypothetical protein
MLGTQEKPRAGGEEPIRGHITNVHRRPMIGLLRVIPQSAGGRQLLKTPRDGPAFNLGLWVLVTIRETSGAAVGRARYLIGYAKCFKVGQERIFPAVAPRVKIHIGKRSVVRVLDTKPAWNLNHFPRRRKKREACIGRRSFVFTCISPPD